MPTAFTARRMKVSIMGGYTPYLLSASFLRCGSVNPDSGFPKSLCRPPFGTAARRDIFVMSVQLLILDERGLEPLDAAARLMAFTCRLIDDRRFELTGVAHGVELA